MEEFEKLDFWVKSFIEGAPSAMNLGKVGSGNFAVE